MMEPSPYWSMMVSTNTLLVYDGLEQTPYWSMMG